MPRECLVCGRPLLRGERHLCLFCLSDLPQTWFWSRSRNPMADSFNALIQRDLVGPVDAPVAPNHPLPTGNVATIQRDLVGPASVAASTLHAISNPFPSPSPGPPECKNCPLSAPEPPFGHPECKNCPLSAPEPPFGHPIGSGGFEYEPYSYAAALFFYDRHANYRRITQALKYNGNLGVGRFFGDMLGERLSGSPMFADVDLVVPVPLHPLRRWRRGYNQAEIIARAIAARLGAPCDPSVLVRRRYTRTQTRLSVEEKAANVRTAFSVPDPSRLLGFHHILLIDDVYTTGATLNACRRTLREALRPFSDAPSQTSPNPLGALDSSSTDAPASSRTPFIRISIATLGFVGSA